MKRLWFFCILLLMGCSGGSKGVLRIGVDPNWYPLNFGSQGPYVNGYTEELLLEIARYSGLELERIPANWDTLAEGLQRKKYDAILTSMEPYVFNTAKYDFSPPFLELGPVLIVPAESSDSDLTKMQAKRIGVITNDPAVLVAQKCPTLIIRAYPTIPDLLNSLTNGEIDGALLDRIPAVSYVNDLYAGKLKIASPPLAEKGLRLAAPKGKSSLVGHFIRALESLKKRKSLAQLQKKWQLD